MGGEGGGAREKWKCIPYFWSGLSGSDENSSIHTHCNTGKKVSLFIFHSNFKLMLRYCLNSWYWLPWQPSSSRWHQTALQTSLDLASSLKYSAGSSSVSRSSSFSSSSPSSSSFLFFLLHLLPPVAGSNHSLDSNLLPLQGWSVVKFALFKYGQQMFLAQPLEFFSVTMANLFFILLIWFQVKDIYYRFLVKEWLGEWWLSLFGCMPVIGVCVWLSFNFTVWLSCSWSISLLLSCSFTVDCCLPTLLHSCLLTWLHVII